MGRKRIEFTNEQQDVIRRLGEIQCTQQEIAHVMGVSQDIIKRHTELIAEGRSAGKVRLRRAQYAKAVDEGNPTLLIWLGKQMLGQNDSPLNTDDNGILPWDTEK